MRRLPILLLTPLLAAPDCGGQSCPPRPPPMSTDRARQLAPEVRTGLAVSTTHVYGDCRPAAVTVVDPCEPAQNPKCARERQPLRVQVLPINLSVRLDPRCAPAFAVEDLAEDAVFDGFASTDGELVIPLEPGLYTVHVAAEEVDRCARCGLGDETSGCVVEVVPNGVAVRELVLDRSSR